MKIIISGGGTGGHVYPAIAIANELSDKGIEDILFVGAKGKLEMEKVPKAGYEIEGLDIRGFHRTKVWRNILFPFKLLGSLMKAKKIIDKFGPDVVIGVGGYASGPTLKMAQVKNIPTVIQEQNSYPGITNKLLAGKADRIFVAYPKMNQYFPEGKLKLTGNPVRKDIMNVSSLRNDAIVHFGLDPLKKTILIFGGSLGARSLNKAILSQHELIMGRDDIQMIWQVGSIYHDEYKSCSLSELPNVRILPFIDRMDLAYAAADVVACRAGALTISELMLVGKPSILVPSPNVAEDHQTKNAQALVDEEAASMVLDKDAQLNLVPSILKLLSDQERQVALSTNLKKMAKPEAREVIAQEIIDLVR